MKTYAIIAGTVMAFFSLIAVGIWYYGVTKKQEGKSEVYTAIAEGKYDRTFTYYMTLSAPKPVTRIIPGTVTKVDTVRLDSLQAQKEDSTIQYLAASWESVIQDSTEYPIDDSTSVIFRAVHNIVVDPIGKVLHDFFVPYDLNLPFREHEKVVLRDPSFWDYIEYILIGTGIGALIAVAL